MRWACLSVKRDDLETTRTHPRRCTAMARHLQLAGPVWRSGGCGRFANADFQQRRDGAFDQRAEQHPLLLGLGQSSPIDTLQPAWRLISSAPNDGIPSQNQAGGQSLLSSVSARFAAEKTPRGSRNRRPRGPHPRGARRRSRIGYSAVRRPGFNGYNQSAEKCRSAWANGARPLDVTHRMTLGSQTESTPAGIGVARWSNLLLLANLAKSRLLQSVEG